MQSEDFTVSIIIVTRNRSTELRRLLTALRFQTYENLEVVLVHGPSNEDDKTLEVIKYFNDINYVSVDFKNIAAARNVGMSISSGRYLIYIDDDAIPEPDCVDQLISQMDHDIGLVAGAVRNPDGITFQYLGGTLDELGEPEQLDLTGKQVPRNFSGLGALFAVRREALESIGGFDEIYSYFLDESEMNIRMTMAGYRSVFHRKAEIIHERGRGIFRSLDGLPSSFLGITRSRIYFLLTYSRKYYTSTVLFNYIEGTIKGQIEAIQSSVELSPDRKNNLMQTVIQGYLEAIHFSKAENRMINWPSTRKTSKLKRFTVHPSAPRIVLCARGWSIEDSGIGKWTRELAAGLAQLGHVVTVISEDNVNHEVSFHDDGYWVHTVPPSFSYRASLPGHISSRVTAVQNEFQEIRDRRGCDVFQFPIWDVEGIEVLENFTDIKSVVSLHTTYGLTKSDHPEWFIGKKLSLPISNVLEAEKECIFKSSIVLANSNAIVAEIESNYDIFFREKTTIIPHSVAIQKNVYPEELGSREIIFIGRLEHRKGIDLFVDAVNEIKSEILQAEFKIKIIGSDTHFWNEYRQTKKSNDLDWLEFTGFISKEEMEKVLSSKPVVVMPSRFESFGLVALEAMANGCAVIASKVGGLTEVLDLGKAGVLVHSLDPTSFATAILEMIYDPNKRTEFQIAGRRTAIVDFSPETVFSRISSLYRRLNDK